jgi:hypothetical protein
MVELVIVVEVWVKADVFAKLQPVVCVGKMRVISMNDVNVPAHPSHLQPKDSWVVSVVREDETNSIAVRNPNKMNAKEHMPIFVDRPVAGKTYQDGSGGIFHYCDSACRQMPPAATQLKNPLS